MLHASGPSHSVTHPRVAERRRGRKGGPGSWAGAPSGCYLPCLRAAGWDAPRQGLGCPAASSHSTLLPCGINPHCALGIAVLVRMKTRSDVLPSSRRNFRLGHVDIMSSCHVTRDSGTRGPVSHPWPLKDDRKTSNECHEHSCRGSCFVSTRTVAGHVRISLLPDPTGPAQRNCVFISRCQARDWSPAPSQAYCWSCLRR